MARRKSIHIGEFKHANPIPNASRIGNLLMSGVILGRDPATGAGARFTPPRWLKVGDVVEVESTKIGVLRNTVAEEK